MKTKKEKATIDAVKAARRASREEEIAAHGKLIRYTKVKRSKKRYDRKVLKREPFVILEQKINTLKHEKSTINLDVSCFAYKL